MLNICNTFSSSTIILGDLNVHFDIPTSPLVLKIKSAKWAQFYQPVTIPTHKLVHALDIVMLTPTDDSVRSTTVTQLLLSDHCCVVCDLSAIKPVNHAELKQSTNLCGINLTTFKADVCLLISATLCLFEMLDDSLRLIFVKHVPLRSCRVPINQNYLWYNSMNSDIIAAKRHRNLAERQYLKNLTILNKQQFSKAANYMVNIMHRAKSKFCLSEINSVTSKRVCLLYVANI